MSLDKHPYRGLILVCGSIVIVLTILALVAHIADFHILGSVNKRFIPMSQPTALSFMLLGIAMILTNAKEDSAKMKLTAAILAALVVLYTGLKFSGGILGLDLTLDLAIFPVSETFGTFAVNRMSVFTSFLLFVTGSVMLVKLIAGKRPLVLNIESFAGLAILFTGFVLLLGYLLGNPLLYEGSIRPPSVFSSVCMMFLGFGLMVSPGRETILLTPFRENRPEARLLRRILPLVIIVILLETFFQRTTLFTTPLRETLLSAVLTGLFILATSLVIIQSSKQVFREASEKEKLRLKAESSLRESEARLELFFSQSLDGFFFMMLDEPVEWSDRINKEKVMDYVFSHQRITKVNDAMIQQYGGTREQFLGLTANDFYAHDIAYGKKVWIEFFDKGTLHLETDERRFDGSQMYVEGDYICMYDSKGRITGHFGIQRDVTDRKLSERKIIQYAEELKESNASKDKFFSIISHDLKSPFNAILGFSQEMMTLARTNNPELIERFASHIHSSARRTYELLENLLEWAKTQQGTISFSPGVVDLGELLQEKTELLRYAAIAKDISLDYTCTPGIRVMADREMLKSILRNLITNAIKFTNPGGNVTVSAERKGEESEISVMDNGIGINEEDRQKLFRIDQTMTHPGTKKERGTGLGLILCKEFVEKNGGRIRVESKPGKGTRVTFTLRSYS